jgi:hypothetical protein
LIAQFRGHHSLGFIKERDERLGGLPGVVAIEAKSRFFLQARGEGALRSRDANQIQIQLTNR